MVDLDPIAVATDYAALEAACRTAIRDVLSQHRDGEIDDDEAESYLQQISDARIKRHNQMANAMFAAGLQDQRQRQAQLELDRRARSTEAADAARRRISEIDTKDPGCIASAFAILASYAPLLEAGDLFALYSDIYMLPLQLSELWQPGPEPPRGLKP